MGRAGKGYRIFFCNQCNDPCAKGRKVYERNVTVFQAIGFICFKCGTLTLNADLKKFEKVKTRSGTVMIDRTKYSVRSIIRELDLLLSRYRQEIIEKFEIDNLLFDCRETGD